MNLPKKNRLKRAYKKLKRKTLITNSYKRQRKEARKPWLKR